MPRVFNSTFENSLRILLLLNAFSDPQTVDMLYAADFMTTYGKVFGISIVDLNGDNQYKFSEFASRRQIVQNALKYLVLEGLVLPIRTSDGITYVATEQGKTLADSFTSDYAKEYKTNAVNVVKKVCGRSERAVIAYINRLSAASISKGD